MREPKKNYRIPRKYTKVGEFLREARERAGLTQREVSVSLGYSSAQFISNFERGIAVPPIKKLKLLQKAYRMDIDRLITLIIDSEREAMLEVLFDEKRSKHQRISRRTEYRPLMEA